MGITKTVPDSFTGQWDRTTVFSDGSLSVSSPVVTRLTWNNSVTYGDNIPGWRKLIREGQNATTSLLGTATKATMVRGSHYVFRDPKWVISSGSPVASAYSSGLLGLSPSLPSGNPNDISDVTANNVALAKFVKKLDSVNTAFHGGVFLGELSQTLHGIRNPAYGLRKLVDRFWYNARNMRSSWKRKVKFIEENTPLHKALADLWLEHSFHWKPLLSDIDDGCRALAELNTSQGLANSRISAVGEADGNPVNTVTSVTSGLLQWYKSETTLEHTIVVYRGAVRVNPRDSVLMAPTLLGFNPASFAPTAWELIPYSFLIDYFTNIGDIISGWSHNTSELSWCNRTVKKEFVRKYGTFCNQGIVDDGHALGEPKRRFTHSPTSVEIRKSSVSRASYVGNFAGTFEFEIPGFGSMKWLNIAALVAGRSKDRSFKFGD